MNGPTNGMMSGRAGGGRIVRHLRHWEGGMRIVVVGGGPGGYSAAFEAARLGAEAVLVERDRLGGTCLNWGCVPTKAILRSAHAVLDSRNAAALGLAGAPLSVNLAALEGRTRGVMDELRGQLEATARRLKVSVVRGEGRLTGPRTVEVRSGGGRDTLEADAVIVATGSVPLRLPNIDHGLDGVWTSDDAVSLKDVPERIVIIGGGVIGLEFACAYAAFGSAVTVVELTEQVLPGMDKRVARTIQQALEAHGVQFRLEDAVESVERGQGGLRATLRSGAGLDADVVLSAVGRVPATAGIGLEEVGIEFDRRAVKVDERFMTNVGGIFAIGDAIGGMMLAHVAEAEGRAAARNAVAWYEAAHAGTQPAFETVRYDCIPACVYTFPNVATVGKTREAAAAQGVETVQAIAKFTGNARALAEGEPEGFVQVVAEKGSGLLVGCQIVGPFAVEIVHEAAVAIRQGLSVASIGHAVHAHPTVSETLMLACEDAAAKVRSGR
ncbi:MAG: dihydrolipoyl dehydrogenase [Coriobacteriia bacterium]|nr:dihydrolipoyl dehydrogenase [Coriobacteriia bacterium]